MKRFSYILPNAVFAIIMLGIFVYFFYLILVPLAQMQESLDSQITSLNTLINNGYHYQGQSSIPLNEYQLIVTSIGWGKPPTILQSHDDNLTIYYDFYSLTYFKSLTRIPMPKE